MYNFYFEKLDVYKDARAYVVKVYSILRQFPKEEQFALCDQLRRAAVSITSNIAEGISRESLKEKIHFLEISYGSLLETFSQFQIACDLGYIPKENVEEIKQDVQKIANKLNALSKSYKAQLP